MSARAAPSPRPRQPYSPRCPSPLGLPPLGFPPLAPHMAFQGPTYPATPSIPVQPKGPPETRVPYPAEARRPLAGATQRPRSQPPPPLTLSSQYHPPTPPQYPKTAHEGAGHAMDSRRAPPSPTPSDTSSLSLYSADSVSKNFAVNAQNREQQQEEEEKPPSLFCGCINFRALFGSKSKKSKILDPPPQPPSPAPQMVQSRRRPSPLNL